MIQIFKNQDDTSFMDITISGNAEEVAQEFAALYIKMHDSFPYILDRATRYIEEITQIRKECSND